MTDTERQIDILKRIINATDEEANSIDFWMHNVRAYGIYPFQWLVELDRDSIYTENGMMQVQGEIANFCRFLSGQEIHSAMEIGVYRGRSSYFICAAIFRKNRDLIYHMVDIVDGLDSYDAFLEILPCMKKQIPHTSEDFKGKEYDFVFIDADHSYEASMQDYVNVGRYAKKIVCFHDIFAHEYDAEGGGCVKTWEEICTLTPQFPKLVFSNFPNRWMGIGVVMNTTENGGTIGRNNDYEDLQREKEAFLQRLTNYKNIWVYGSRNDSRRMFWALKQADYPVRGMVVNDESEIMEKLPKYPVTLLNKISLDLDTAIVICYRDSLRQIPIQHINSPDNTIIVSDMMATFL